MRFCLVTFSGLFMRYLTYFQGLGKCTTFWFIGFPAWPTEQSAVLVRYGGSRLMYKSRIRVNYWCYRIQFGNPLDLYHCVFGWIKEGIRYSRNTY